jgi:hypothetical protein
VPFTDNVENYDTARQATHENIIRRMLFSCCVTKATNTQSEYVILISFSLGHAVAQFVEALRYKPEGRGFDSQ